MNKEEMITEILKLCKSNRNNPYCDIFWLADMIKEIVEGKSYLGDLQAETYEEMINEIWSRRRVWS